VPAQDVSPPADVREAVLRHAGSRPGRRDAVDARIVAGVENGTVRIIDDPAQVGGLPDTPPVTQAADIPADPFATAGNGQSKIEAWLCARSLALGAAPTPECPMGAQTVSRRR
jgi:hypothetical protein